MILVDASLSSILSENKNLNLIKFIEISFNINFIQSKSVRRFLVKNKDWSLFCGPIRHKPNIQWFIDQYQPIIVLENYVIQIIKQKKKTQY